MKTWSFAFSGLRRGWSSPELVILAIAIAVAVAASSAVSLFSDRVARALANQSGETFGADAALLSRTPLPADVTAALDGIGLARTEVAQFPSMAAAGERTTLVSVKAAGDGYPLRGTLRTAPEPFAPERVDAAGPVAGEAWVDARLWQDLGLKAGASIQLGRSTFHVARILTYEPDRGGGFGDLAPRVLIRLADLDATGLLGPGSRVSWSALVAGDEAQVGKLKALALPTGMRLVTPQDGRPEIRNSLSRARQFLDIAVLAAMLLAGAAIAVTSHQHGVKLRDEAALLKVLGAPMRLIAARSLVRLLALALAAGAAGLAIGALAQMVVGSIAAGLMDAPLPPARPVAALWSLGVALVLVLGFAAPPWLAARRTPPIRIFQRDVATTGSRAAALAAGIAGAVLVGLHTGDAKLAVYVLGGAVGTALVLGLAAFVLVRALAGMRARGGAALRFGLANIARRRAASVGQATALGLSLLALLLVAVVHRDLLDSWRQRLPPETPNQFLINIQPEQVEPLTAFFRERGYTDLGLWPMTRGRLIAFNGRPVTPDSFEDPETRRWINREFNLSWTDRFGADNALVAGTWWDESARGEPWLSVDDYARERLNLKLGDKLRLSIADREIELEVRNVRKVSWDSFRPNFFLVTPPGVLDDGPTQWITSFYLPPERRALLRELVAAFPNVTALDLDAAMAQVRGIIDRVVRAVEFIFLFTLAAGITVLLAAIEGTRAERVRETALLRTLGASTRTITLGLLAEYAALGLVAGLVASAAAQAIGWALAVNVFDLEYRFNPVLWAAGSLGGAALVCVLGWWSLRRTLSTPPRTVLAVTG